MNIKKVCGILGLAVLVVALMALPRPAKAEMFVEAYIGGSTAADAKTNFSGTGSYGGNASTLTNNLGGATEASVIGGLKIGTWFVKEGFLGYDYPDWMKYLGFYVDVSYQRLNFSRQTGSSVQSVPAVAFSMATTNNFFTEGDAFTLAFMFAGRYGFLPDSEVPFGRLQPYVAVGPAILFSSQEPKLRIRPILNPDTGLTENQYGISPGSRSSTDICLAAEGGLRYMCLKNVSVDVSFKYRYAQPTYKYTFADPFPGVGGGVGHNWDFTPTYHLFSGQLGVAYHF